LSGGRPSDYKPEYCELLIKHAEEGYSFESFAGRIGVTPKTLYNWEQEHPEFLQAKTVAKHKMLYADETVLNMGAKGLIENYHGASQIFKMKAVHKWTETAKIESENLNVNLNADLPLDNLTDDELSFLEKIQTKIRGANDA
jgi:transposase-like protein